MNSVCIPDVLHAHAVPDYIFISEQISNPSDAHFRSQFDQFGDKVKERLES